MCPLGVRERKVLDNRLIQETVKLQISPENGAVIGVRLESYHLARRSDQRGEKNCILAHIPADIQHEVARFDTLNQELKLVRIIPNNDIRRVNVFQPNWSRSVNV